MFRSRWIAPKLQILNSVKISKKIYEIMSRRHGSERVRNWQELAPKMIKVQTSDILFLRAEDRNRFDCFCNISNTNASID